MDDAQLCSAEGCMNRAPNDEVLKGTCIWLRFRPLRPATNRSPAADASNCNNDGFSAVRESAFATNATLPGSLPGSLLRAAAAAEAVTAITPDANANLECHHK